MKLEIACTKKFIDRLDSAARAVGISRERYVRSILDAANDAVFEREKMFAAFQRYYAASGHRARANFE
jgi:hypothetical protein